MMREPAADMRGMAQSMYDMYLGFVAAGFNEPQALYLIATAMGTAMRADS